MMIAKWVRFGLITFMLIAVFAIHVRTAEAWSDVPVVDDPNVRMPGTQPDLDNSVPDLAAPVTCNGCHGGYSGDDDDDQGIDPMHNWRGSMMSQSARDPLFWAALTVAAQDSIWAFGNPNGTDICLRCHMPKGWLEGKSDPTNGSAMVDADFDGVQCDFCHRLYNPFFEATNDGTREGNNFGVYFDETNLSGTPSNTAAATTYGLDAALAATITQFNGDNFFNSNVPANANYKENATGQYFVSTGTQKRASFADAGAPHPFLYSRYHKSKFFCSTCHDVSNSVLANQGADPTETLPAEANSAYTYAHVERTFSEFMLSDFGAIGGAPGRGAFQPAVFDTSNPNEDINTCQDCHMRDVNGEAAVQPAAIDRPAGSVEHPNSGQPLHDLTGGNVYIPALLARTVPASPNYRADIATLLDRPAELTMNLSAGLGLDATALLDGSERAKDMLQSAARISNLKYDVCSGLISFRVINDTGHKLITGYPEGRRMWLNIRVFADPNAQPTYVINPYNREVGTLKGMPDAPLGANERYVDELVYEVQSQSSITDEDHTFHFILSTERYKDNRIPPRGFDTTKMVERMAEPYHHGDPAPDYFTADEYEGGYDDVAVLAVPGARRVEVRLFYQTTSREYVAFLRDEINGDFDGGEGTLTGLGKGGDPAYIAQTDPFFAGLKDWGDTIWTMWNSTKNMDGAAPYQMTQASVDRTSRLCAFLPNVSVKN